MKFEAVVPKALAHTFNTAVFRYLDLRHVSPLDETIVVESQPHGDDLLMSVRLGSEAAAAEFASFWSALTQPTPPYTFAPKAPSPGEA